MYNDTPKKCAELFQRSEALTKLLASIQDYHSECWLVGGCLRDLLLQRPVTDIDIASSTDPTEFAKNWAAEVHGRWFWLDAERLHSRVLVNSQFQVDFSPLRAESITKDLELRDFTINSLALSLRPDLTRSALLDPLGGQVDLHHRHLRESSQLSFQDDPLRMLKGVRHAVTLDFRFAATTSASLKKHSARITSVAGERIRAELLQIFQSEAPLRGLELLYETGLLQALFGPSETNLNWPNIQLELNAFHQTLIQLHSMHEKKQTVTSRADIFPLLAIFLLVKFLQFYKPTQLSDLLHDKLRFSRYEQQLVQQLISQEENTAAVFPLLKNHLSQRMKALVVELLEPFSLEKMLYWGAAHKQLSYLQIMNFIHAFRNEQKFGRVPDLISGRELAEITDNLSGPDIGRWQKKLKYAEINGEISTIHDASEWLKSKLSFDKNEL